MGSAHMLHFVNDAQFHQFTYAYLEGLHMSIYLWLDIEFLRKGLRITVLPPDTLHLLQLGLEEPKVSR